MRDVIFSKYSNDRAAEFNIVTDVVRDEEGERYAIKRPFTEAARDHVSRIVENGRLLKQQLRNTAIEVVDAREDADGVLIPWVDGDAFSSYLDRLLMQGLQNEWKDKIDEYFANLFKNSKHGFARTEEFGKVFGDVQIDSEEESIANMDIDMLFSNVIFRDDKWVAYDYEWTFPFDIPIKYLIYRCLLYYCNTQSKIGLKAQGLYGKFCITPEQCKCFDEMEENFQNYVKGDHEPLWKLYKSMYGEVVPVCSLHDNYVQRHKAQVYYDFGNGYSEEDSKVVIPEQYMPNHYRILLRLPKGIRQLRFDPASCACRLDVSHVKNQDGEDLPYAVNGYLMHDSSYLCMKSDTHINIDLGAASASLEVVEVEYEMRMMDGNDESVMLEVNDVFQALQDAEYRLRLMEHTISWRITKPLRWMTQLFRRLKRI